MMSFEGGTSRTDAKPALGLALFTERLPRQLSMSRNISFACINQPAVLFTMFLKLQYGKIRGSGRRRLVPDS